MELGYTHSGLGYCLEGREEELTINWKQIPGENWNLSTRAGHLFIFKQLSTQSESQIACRERKKKTLQQVNLAVNEWEVRNPEHWRLLSANKNISCSKNP